MSVIVTRRTRARPRSRVLAIARRLDWLLLAATAGLCALGLTVLGDATRHDIAGDPQYYVRRQAIYFIVGGIGMVAMSAIDPSLWRRLRVPLYLGTLSLVAVVLVLGTTIRGSTRSSSATARESEVHVLLFAQGLTNEEIAKQLFISLSTTKVHVKHISEKLGVRSAGQSRSRHDV